MDNIENTVNSHYFYIASGWFNEYQILDLMYIKTVLSYHRGVTYYSPREECEFKEDAQVSRSEVYRMNINAIEKSSVVIVNTRDKDMGTIFEAGYAAALGKKIIYVNFDRSITKFNLMLAESGIAVANTPEALHAIVCGVLSNTEFKLTYKGEVE